MATWEDVLDLLTKQLAELFNSMGYTHEYLHSIQKTIRGGQVRPGRAEEEKMVLYGLDAAISEPEEELTLAKALFIDNNSEYQMSFSLSIMGGDEAIFNPDDPTDLISAPTITLTRPWTSSTTLPSILIDNITQLMLVDQFRTDIDPEKAAEILKDRTIYELLSQAGTRDERITAFYNEFIELIGDPPTDFQWDSDADNFVDNAWYETGGAAYDWWIANDLTGQDNWVNLPEDVPKYITRLTDFGSPSIEGMRNILNEYLRDVDETGRLDYIDDRPEYRNVSPGYLKIRNLNQSIIVRNLESDDVGLGTLLNPKWQSTGFTITMWTRFLDKVSSGTLFNFGNPLRTDNSYGFMLDTYIVKSEPDVNNIPSYIIDGWDDAAAGGTNMPYWAFEDSEAERFIRLVVRDNAEDLRDSNVGFSGLSKIDTRDFADDPIYTTNYERSVWQYTRVPIDLQEWYFIVATYSPYQDEDLYIGDGSYTGISDFWKWNLEDDLITYTSNSGLGNKCKVEIISKTDLLRARGYKS